ncbi:hypothetical protein L5515_005777 [Caenorhabditis briggsae]|uniref:Decapping nuclease n=1 Tax=Caenorhabditis briggsae TaxID=6238 RepID=A0AAE9JHW3_CAEBR|nr:hypothetical protein L5515_005777 [Caenorhabditis briggsae]
MSVKIDVKRVGTFTKLADKLVSNTDSNEKYQCFRTAVPGGQGPRLNEDPSLEEEVAWPQGHTFERYLTLNEEGNPHDKYEELHTEERFKLVLRTTLKTTAKPPIKVFYAAEIDAVDSKGEYVEMKTTGQRHDMWLERNSLKHYLQSALANIPYIFYGKKARGRWNHIYRVDKVFTEQIPRDRVNWKKDVCFEQLFNVLDKIKSKLEYDDEALVLKMTEEGLFFEPECSKNCIFMDSDFLTLCITSIILLLPPLIKHVTSIRSCQFSVYI